MFRCILLSVLYLLTSAMAVRAQEAPPLDAYRALPSVEMVQLSPSGGRLAYVTVMGDERAMLISDLRDGETLGGGLVGHAKVRDVAWVGEDHVLITTSVTQTLPQFGLGLTEFFIGQIYSIRERKFQAVFNRTRGVLSIMADQPQVRMIDGQPTILVRGFAPGRSRGLDLYRINPDTGQGTLALELDYHTEGVTLDDAGLPLARTDYIEARRRWSLHLGRSPRSFREVWNLDASVDTPYLIGPGRRPRTVLIGGVRGDMAPPPGVELDADNATFFEVDVDTDTWTPIDAGYGGSLSLLSHPRTGLVHGTVRRSERCDIYEFSEVGLARMWASALRVFPDTCVAPVSWSDNLRQMVLFTEGGDDAGTYHLIDLDTREYLIVGERYPALSEAPPGEIRPIRYTAGDGLEIHGYLTLPPGMTTPRGLPLVVLAHGGPAAQDVYGFDWWSQALASRGYAVLQANFRGSTGYGRDFMEAGYGQWGRLMQTDLSDGVRSLAEQGLIDPARVCVVGASYGGYAALAGVTLQQDIYRCAVSVNGLTDLRRFVEWRAGRGVRRDNQAVRYWSRFMGVDRAGDRALDALSPAMLADQGRAPVLLLHGRDDTVVPFDQARRMAETLRAAGRSHQLVELSGEDHWLSRADTRQRMLAETIRFLETHNPAR